MTRDENNLQAFMDAMDEWEESGFRDARPLYCITPGCDFELMDYDITWGHYRCPSCGRQVENHEVDAYVEEMHAYDDE